MKIPITKSLKSVVKIKPKCGSGIGFQSHTPGTKENILSRNIFWVKIMILTQNHKFLEFSKSLSCAQFAPGCKFAPGVQICTRGVFLAM